MNNESSSPSPLTSIPQLLQNQETNSVDASNSDSQPIPRRPKPMKHRISDSSMPMGSSFSNDFDNTDSLGILHEAETQYEVGIRQTEEEEEDENHGAAEREENIDNTDNTDALEHAVNAETEWKTKVNSAQHNISVTNGRGGRGSYLDHRKNSILETRPLTFAKKNRPRKTEKNEKSEQKKKQRAFSMNADVLKPRLSRTGGRIDPGADYPEDLKARLAASYNTRNYDPYLSSTGTPPVINGFRKSPLHRRDTLIPNGNDVVIDVDELMRHVKHKGTHKKKGHQDDRHSRRSYPSSSASYSTSTRSTDVFQSDMEDEDEDEYNSRPSSRRSSNNSSLDDVCLVLEDEDENLDKMWPDVAVLEEFSKEETEKLRRQAIRDAEAFHFQYDEDEEPYVNNDFDDQSFPDANDRYTKAESSSGIFFSKPIVTNIDVPELGNKRVNEAEQLNTGRLRPRRLAPWHLTQNKHQGFQSAPGMSPVNPAIPGNSELRDNFLVGRNIQYPSHIISSNPEHFRFTYFRIDLDATVHSPTISGLLQPGQKYQDLFVASIYADQRGSSNFSGANTPLNTKANTPSHSNSHLIKNPSNMSNSASGTHLGSNAADLEVDLDEVAPFWLDVVNPTEEEMKILSKAFGIHPLTTEDIFLGETREKVELFKDYYFICFRSFDIIAEKHVLRQKRNKYNEDTGTNADRDSVSHRSNRRGWLSSFFRKRRRSSNDIKRGGAEQSLYSSSLHHKADKQRLKMIEERNRKRKSGDRHKPREGELQPLNVYIIVFRTGVLTFHFAPTPHPINVRRRARLLKDYLNVTSDWIAYALIDDITDAFGPMIELIEDEVYDIEDAILKMHHTYDDSDSDSSDSDSDSDYGDDNESTFSVRGANKSSGGENTRLLFDKRSKKAGSIRGSIGRRSFETRSSRSYNTFSSRTRSSSSSSRSSDSSLSSINPNIIGWKKKGDMLRRIGECRKRVMSILRLLGWKADVIKGFAKRYNEQWDFGPQSEIGIYLGDIQDHIVTMVASLNHYEKLLSRSHSNYLAQINIDMTRVNNDMNDVLGKITILGTIVLPMNVITGLWGMNVIVPGQFNESLNWFMSIVAFMFCLAYGAYVYTKKRFDF